MFDYEQLRRLLRQKHRTCRDLAEEIGVSAVSLSRKMNGTTQFTLGEIQGIRESLGLTLRELELIFFAPELAKTQEDRMEKETQDVLV